MRWLAPVFLLLVVISFLVEASSRGSKSAADESSGTESAVTSSHSEANFSEETARCSVIASAPIAETNVFLRTLSGLWRNDLIPARTEGGLTYFDGLSLSVESRENYLAKIFINDDFSISEVRKASFPASSIRVGRSDSEGFRTVQLEGSTCLEFSLKVIFSAEGPPILLAREPNGTLSKFVQ